MSQLLSRDLEGDRRPAADALSTNGRSGGRSILLIDDNDAVAGAMAIAFRIAGHRLDVAVDPADAFSRLARARYDAILLDLNFTPGRADGGEGLDCLSRIVADDAGACVVVITAHSGIRIAVAAMQAGAREFVMKPWRNADLIAKVEAAITRDRPVVAAAGSDPAPVMLGDSAAIRALRALVHRIAPTSASVVVAGPPGSGRMLAARAIHAGSPDAATPATRIDLRDPAAWGRLGEATGTVILRHPDRLDAVAQRRLLDDLPSTARCIAIVDRVDLLDPALRHRIATVEIAVPPLADRDDDAVMLARHFARAAAERFGRPPPVLTGAAVAAIRATRWPDEVRGLALVIERATVLAEDATIDAALLTRPSPPAAPVAEEMRFDLIDAEKAVIRAALAEHRHNVTHAAAALGLSRGALYRRMARHGL